MAYVTIGTSSRCPLEGGTDSPDELPTSLPLKEKRIGEPLPPAEEGQEHKGGEESVGSCTASPILCMDQVPLLQMSTRPMACFHSPARESEEGQVALDGANSCHALLESRRGTSGAHNGGLRPAVSVGAAPYKSCGSCPPLSSRKHLPGLEGASPAF